MEYLLSFIVVGLIIRTSLWHLQNWQIREYRFDRLLSHTRTKEGVINIFNLWFFKGILPRPKFTGRIFMIIGLILLFFVISFYPLSEFIVHTLLYFNIWEYTTTDTFPQPSSWFGLTHAILIYLILNERLIWLTAALAVTISKIPTYISRELLFRRAEKIIKNSQNLTTIGIAGSYGKSSTKEILVHLLTKGFGSGNILFNPENQNNEVAIARLICSNQPFFESRDKKLFVCEVGAYRRGEIAKVCRFIQPKMSLLTGLNAQHIELFGSQRNIQRAKFEMAEHTSKKVFFNIDNNLLREIFEDEKIQATKIALSPKTLKNIKEDPDQTHFQLYGKKFTLPWPGKFFVDNALLAIECARELGIKRGNLPDYLKTLPPLERALKITKKDKFTVLWDTYSANPDGVIKAVEHLGTFTGKKVFIGIPLKELGNEAEKVHHKIFAKLKSIKAKIYWGKADFSNLGKKVNGKNFVTIDPDKKSDITKIKRQMKILKEGDVVLLEAKLPESILELFK